MTDRKLIYIADIIFKLYETPLDELLKWTRADLIELMGEINNEDNEYRIKVLDKNKFAATVIDIAKQKRQALAKDALAASPSSSQVKLLFLGKEEEEAIEDIQSAHKFMDQKLIKMKAYTLLFKH